MLQRDDGRVSFLKVLSSPPNYDQAVIGALRSLVRSGAHTESSLSPFGEFTFRDIPRDRMHLAIEVGAERLEIGPFGEPD